MKRSPELQRAIDCAFFGARFETGVVGVVREVHVLDLASAFPAGMVTLPCLADGRWEHHPQSDAIEFCDLTPSSMVRVRWDLSPLVPGFGPYPYRRRDGSLIYPLAGHAWLWKEEIEAGILCYGDVGVLRFLEGWEFIPGCDHQPFDEIPNLYATRLQLGKDAEGLVIKYALNSLYGKLAQTVAGGGRFTDFVWAGMITARIRARLLQLLTVAGEHVLMFASDAVYLDINPSELPGIQTFTNDPPLGSWGYDPAKDLHRNVLIVKSGMWFEGNDGSDTEGAIGGATGKRHGRSRGFSDTSLSATDAIARLYAAYQRDGLDAEVRIDPDHVPSHKPIPKVFVGAPFAFQVGKPEWIATWQPLDKTISFAPEPKRLRTPRRRGETFVRTVPASNDARLAKYGVNAMLELSAPYRRIRRKDDEKALHYDQPDRVDGLTLLVGEDEP